MAGDGKQTPTVFVHPKTGRVIVATRELAVLTAHEHCSVLQAVRRAEIWEPDRDLTREIYRGEYIGRNGHVEPCCWLTREALVATFGRMHNVPGCRDMRAVLNVYLEMIDKREAEQRAKVTAERQAECDRLLEEITESFVETNRLRERCGVPPLTLPWQKVAEPAPDSEIQPPDPEPADTLETVPPLPAEKVTAHLSMSWLIDQAVARNALVDMPERLLADLIDWNKQRRQQLLLSLFKPGGAEQAAPSTKPICSPRRDDSLGLGDCH